MSDERYDINPEGEEDAEAHFEEMLDNGPEFRRIWEESRPRRELGRRVLGCRIELGLSQKALAGKVGTSQNRIYLIEAGEANPTLDTLERLASALGATFEIHPSEPLAGRGSLKNPESGGLHGGVRSVGGSGFVVDFRLRGGIG